MYKKCSKLLLTISFLFNFCIIFSSDEASVFFRSKIQSKYPKEYGLVEPLCVEINHMESIDMESIEKKLLGMQKEIQEKFPTIEIVFSKPEEALGDSFEISEETFRKVFNKDQNALNLEVDKIIAYMEESYIPEKNEYLMSRRRLCDLKKEITKIIDRIKFQELVIQYRERLEIQEKERFEAQILSEYQEIKAHQEFEISKFKEKELKVNKRLERRKEVTPSVKAMGSKFKLIRSLLKNEEDEEEE